MTMRRPKVCVFIPSFGGGGAERQCAYLVNGLVRRSDIELVLVHFHEGVNFERVDSAVRRVRIKTSSNYDPRNVVRASGVFAREKPDVVFSWLHACDVYAWGARALGGRFKWVMAERDSWYPRDPRFMARSLVGRTADMVISNSRQGDAYWAKRSVPKDRRAIVDNILPNDWFTAAPVARDFMCYAGRLEPQKNVAVLVEAFVALSERRADAKFVVVGQGSLEDSLKGLAAKAAPGSLALQAFRPDIRSVFERAAVFVNLSHHEGRPNTVIENLALGNRVVLSRIPEHVDLVGDDYPFLVEVGMSAGEISTVLERALDAPMSNLEKDAARARLEPMREDRVVDAYVDIFNTVIGR
jgi:glycosyltransferase involved in cell wall biosynthesis